MRLVHKKLEAKQKLLTLENLDMNINHTSVNVHKGINSEMSLKF